MTLETALLLSSLSSYRGVTGQLVTIESASEEAFVRWESRTGSFWMGIVQNLSLIHI